MGLLVLHGDQAVFDVVFGAATVNAVPGIITGSAAVQRNGVAACVEGDERSVRVAASYMSGAFAGGVGILSIDALGSDQLARRAKCGQRALILKGTVFRAKLQVVVQALNASGSADPSPLYFGTGSFVTANSVLLAE